eukprot:TRINITY_DN7856_c0_g1_i1.p1 TRINITY_DN7856_c0_g1~~TRINITY_DN7856_c0_g1_i1.p1  ORF type:complete len:245 (+),score=45.40 TRINITY_DN7856_c0_g1_i1:50-784(+)
MYSFGQTPPVVKDHILRQQKAEHALKEFWEEIMAEITELQDPKDHNLPLERIKKIMKFDEDVQMIRGEVRYLFAKACEAFIRELSLLAWQVTEENKRKTLQKNDVATAVERTEIYDFLEDIVPKEDIPAKQAYWNNGMIPPMYPGQMPAPGYYPGAPQPYGMYNPHQPMFASPLFVLSQMPPNVGMQGMPMPNQGAAPNTRKYAPPPVNMMPNGYPPAPHPTFQQYPLAQHSRDGTIKEDDRNQ